MVSKIVCSIFVVLMMSLTMTSALRCYTCADGKDCGQSMDCNDGDSCVKADINMKVLGETNSVMKTCSPIDPCTALNILPYTKATCYFCKTDLCNGIERNSLNVLIGISCIIAVFTFSKRLF